jgi:hypothetical protein
MGWTTEESGFDSWQEPRDFSLLYRVQTTSGAHWKLITHIHLVLLSQVPVTEEEFPTFVTADARR